MTPTLTALSAGAAIAPPQAETHFAIALVAAICVIIVLILLAALRDQAQRARELDAIVEANRKRLHASGHIVVPRRSKAGETVCVHGWSPFECPTCQWNPGRHAPLLVEGDLSAEEGEAD